MTLRTHALAAALLALCAVPAFAGCSTCDLLNTTPLSSIIGTAPVAGCDNCGHTDDTPPPAVIKPAETADCGNCG